MQFFELVLQWRVALHITDGVHHFAHEKIAHLVYVCKNFNSNLTEVHLSLLSKSPLLLCSLKECAEVAPDKFGHIGDMKWRSWHPRFQVVCCSSSDYFHVIWYFSEGWLLVLLHECL